MKRLEKAITIAGFLLIIVAAYFLVAISLQFFGPGIHSKSAGGFFRVGQILYNAYHLSSLLVPVFFFVAGICCFSTTWNDKKGFMLLFSVVPFFTIVQVEKLCRGLIAVESGSLLYIKMGALITISAMVIAIEYAIAGIIGIKIENRRKEKKQETPSQTWLVHDIDEFPNIESDFQAEPDKDAESDLQEAEPDDFDQDTVIQEEQNAEDHAEIETESVISDEEIPQSQEEAAFLSDPFGEQDLQQHDEPAIDSYAETVCTQDDDLDMTEQVDTENEQTYYEEESEFEEAEETVYEEQEEMDEVFPTIAEVMEEYEDEEPEEDDIYELSEPDFPAFQQNSDNDDDLDMEDVFAADTNFELPFFSEPSKPKEETTEQKPQSLLKSMTVITESDPKNDEKKENLPLVERSVPARKKNAPYQVPSEGLLTSYPDGEYWVIDDDTLAASGELKDTLSEFKIEAEVTGIRKGPVITMFEILPAPGVKLSKIVALQDNIALRLAASSVRIVAPIPGKHAVGIEVPNKERAIVSFKELIETDAPGFRKHAVPVVLGKDITGEAQIIDLAKTPHLLIAGSTGSGKSVCVNTMILSILYKRSPQDVKMILIDPKIVELKLYNDIPHLLVPVITEPKKAFQALQYCLCEMERRYALLDGMGVRDITNYNHRIKERNIATEKLPYIVVIIDEFADLMATTGKELESTVARLAAMSRAVGIHLVLATQRPSIDVITGLIKANIPTRIAFMVASKMDSRIIIDQVGAEKLLGKGDMLYASATNPFPVRIQGTFVSDSEVENVVEYVKQYGEPEYIDDEMFVDDEEAELDPGLFSEGDDPLYDQALEIVMQAGKASASYIQRRLKIGYNRAARLVEEMEARGIVGPANGSKPRDILQMP